jgi:hypothetical protein
LPVRRRCTVRSGITTTSSWSEPMAGLALGRQQADHLAGKLLDADFAAHRVLAAEQLAAHRPADDAHRLAGTLLVSLKVRPAASTQLPARK